MHDAPFHRKPCVRSIHSSSSTHAPHSCWNRWYNPSLVEYGDRLVSAIKTTSYLDRAGKVWWINKLFMCEGKKQDGMQGLR